jgi:cation-transporting ATPase E
MNAAQFARAADEADVFGRVTPEQKADLVRALRRRGHYVAMVGDGLNDVLALKQADLSVALEGGSQAARSVADLVLLRDSFAALPHAFREGQRIRNGMQDVFKLFLTRVLSTAALLLSTAVIGGAPYEPKQNSLLTLLTVGIPTIALAAWARPGAVRGRGLVRPLVGFVVPAAATLALVGLAAYLIPVLPALRALALGFPAVSFGQSISPRETVLDPGQSVLTIISVVCGLLLVPFVQPPSRMWVGGNPLSGDWRPALLALALLAAFGVILAVPPLRAFFELTPLPLGLYLVIACVAALWALALRWIWRARVFERYLDLAPAAPDGVGDAGG